MQAYAFTNKSDDVQVIRTSDGHLERTLFPGQQVIFEADPDQYLEVFSNQLMSSLLVDRWPCCNLNLVQSKSWDRGTRSLVTSA